LIEKISSIKIIVFFLDKNCFAKMMTELEESSKDMQRINSERKIHSLDEKFIRPSDNQQKPVGKVQMKKQLGLLEGVAIILGIIFGSGIFNLHFQ